jgi:hypothetical protein
MSSSSSKKDTIKNATERMEMEEIEALLKIAKVPDSFFEKDNSDPNIYSINKKTTEDSDSDSDSEQDIEEEIFKFNYDITENKSKKGVGKITNNFNLPSNIIRIYEKEKKPETSKDIIKETSLKLEYEKRLKEDMEKNKKDREELANLK